MIGQTILGAYQLVEIIGKGGMSVVYKARHKVTDQVVALKILPAELAVHDDIKARFIEEAKALARLEHPNIVRLYHFGEEGGRFVLAMQFVEGTTFERMIFTAGRLDWREAASVTCQVLSALEFAHKRGVIHRDIKPSNVLVRPDGSAMVMDFGIAKMSESSSRLTATGQTMGTVRYMSPEQVRGRILDQRSDLYSVGVTLFEAIVGDTPFDGATHFDIMMKHLNEPAPTLASRLSGQDVPAALEAVIARALAKELRARYQEAAELRAELEAVLTAAGAPLPGVHQSSGPWRAEPAEPATSSFVAVGPVAGISGLLEPEAPRPRRARRLALLAAVGVLVAGGAVGTLLLLRGGEEPPPPAVWQEPFLIEGLVPLVDRRFDDPENVRVLSARPIDAERIAAAALAARRRFAAYVRQKADLPVTVTPLNLVVAAPAVLCAPALHPAGVPDDCAERPPHFVYPPRKATLYLLDDDGLESVNLVEGVSAHVCIATPSLLEKRCMRGFLPPYWDEVEKSR